MSGRKIFEGPFNSMGILMWKVDWWNVIRFKPVEL